MRKVNEIEIPMQAVTTGGCVVYTSVIMNEDYTMNQLVSYLRFLGYKNFRIIGSMRTFAEVPA